MVDDMEYPPMVFQYLLLLEYLWTWTIHLILLMLAMVDNMEYLVHNMVDNMECHGQ